MSALSSNVIKHWDYVANYLHVPHSEMEYEQQLQLVDELMALSSRNKKTTELLTLIASNIEKYENKLYPKAAISSNEMLKFLMEQHDLTQADLPEIGSQSLVSKILHGERQLTAEHINKLSRRFKVSPAVFFSVV